MGHAEAATRIVEIHDELIEQFLGVERRSELMFEQGRLWDEHFWGRPYEAIAADSVEGTSR